jgi:hypothetical protein
MGYINGDLILNTGVVTSLSSQFKVDYLFHDGSGGSGFKGEVVFVSVYDDWACTESSAGGHGLMFNDFKN